MFLRGLSRSLYTEVCLHHFFVIEYAYIHQHVDHTEKKMKDSSVDSYTLTITITTIIMGLSIEERIRILRIELLLCIYRDGLIGIDPLIIAEHLSPKRLKKIIKKKEESHREFCSSKPVGCLWSAIRQEGEVSKWVRHILRCGGKKFPDPPCSREEALKDASQVRFSTMLSFAQDKILRITGDNLQRFQDVYAGEFGRINWVMLKEDCRKTGIIGIFMDLNPTDYDYDHWVHDWSIPSIALWDVRPEDVTIGKSTKNEKLYKRVKVERLNQLLQ